jgi:hypothetical protein
MEERSMTALSVIVFASLVSVLGCETGASTSESTETVSTTQEGTGSSAQEDTSSQSETIHDTASEVVLPTANAPFDYQIGGAYTPPEKVEVVSRDRKDAPEPGLYNLCYVNGFQTQPDEKDFWLNDHPDLVLRYGNGDPVEDEDWGEFLLDTSTPQKRAALADIVGAWIEGCAEVGFDAVEIDNLDSYGRSTGLLTMEHNVAFMAELSARGHAAGLAMGQKNSTELLEFADEMGTQFAVAEECNRWNECGDYQEIYGDLVFVIEYLTEDFEAGCAKFPELSIVLRDLNVSTPSSRDYVFDGC